MALELNGTTGVSLVQDGVITDANLPAGSVLQVVHQEGKTSTTAASGSTTLFCGWTTSITLSSTSNKILVVGFLPAAVERTNGGDPYLLDVSMLHQQGTLTTTGSGGTLEFSGNTTSKILFDLFPLRVRDGSSNSKDWHGFAEINQLVTTSNLENHFTFSHRTNNDMVSSDWNKQFGDGSYYQIALMEIAG